MFSGLFAKFVALPLIGKVVGAFTNRVAPFVRDKKRLIIEYILIAVIVASAATVFTLWLQREKTENKLVEASQKIDGLKKRVHTVEQINATQDRTIKTLNELREQDATALGGLLNDYTRLSERDKSVQKQIAELEKNNEKVRSYLSQPLPPELRSLLTGQTRNRNPSRN